MEKGASLQSKYTVRYEFYKVDFEKYKFDNDSGIFRFQVGPLYFLIYSPYDNSTLYLVLSISTILSESYLPISVQEGNAFDLGTNETASVIWSANATASSIYSVPLASKGWYTISLFGPVTNTGVYMILPIIENFDCWMSLRIIYEGKYSPFIVTHGPH